MTLKSAVLLLVVAACGGSAPPAPVPTAKPQPAHQIETGLLPVVEVRGEDVRHTLEERMREHRIHAVSIAVFANYELVFAKAYGLADVETGARADENTTFLAGSISKSVNALGQLSAVADGLLSLDAPINNSLASWKLPDNELTRAKPVTLRMLLSHTAGTTVHGFPGYASGQPLPTIQQILDGEPPANTPAIRVDLAPGEKFRYSGGGTTISQLALTERSRKPYPQVLEERVLRPLAMTHSSFDQTLTADRLQHAAVGYGPEGKAIDGKRFRYPEMAAAGLWTTPSDLARFFIEVAKGRAGRSKVISKQIAMQMTTQVAPIEGAGGIGLGVFLMDRNGTGYFGHNGADAGFQASATASLEGGNGIVIMTNSENGHFLFPEIERTVLRVYGWPGAATPIVRVALDPAQRKRFLGRYQLEDIPFEVIERGGKLVIRSPFDDGSELVPTGADVVIHTRDASEIRVADGELRISNDGRPARAAARATTDHPLFLLEAGKFDDAVAALVASKSAKADEDRINLLGYRTLARDPAKAAEILRLNAVAFPDSANAHDSYGEALAKSGKSAEAIAEFERVLAVLAADARIPASDKPMFKKRAEDELAKLRGK